MGKLADLLDELETKLLGRNSPFALGLREWEEYWKQVKIYNIFIYSIVMFIRWIQRKIGRLNERWYNFRCTISPKNVIKFKTLSKFGFDTSEALLNVSFEMMDQYIKDRPDLLTLDITPDMLQSEAEWCNGIVKLRELKLWWDERSKVTEKENYTKANDAEDTAKLIELVTIRSFLW